MVFFRYILAGGVATAVHYALLLALVEVVGWAPAPSAMLGASTGAVVSYLINRELAFSDTSARHQDALPRFLLVALAGAAMNGALVWGGSHLLGMHYLAAQAVATVVVLGVTFKLNRSWTFAR
jgi:putative flippase GtrA